MRRRSFGKLFRKEEKSWLLPLSVCPAPILSLSPPLCPLQFSPARREFVPAVSQKERFCKIYLDIFHLLSNHSSLLFPLPVPIFLCESLSSCSLIFHPGDSLCCSKWFTSLISPLLVTLTLSPCLPHPPSPSLSHSVPVSLALNQSVSLSLWRLGNTFLFQTARSDLLPGSSSSGGWLVSSSAPPPVAAPTAALSKS